MQRSEKCNAQIILLFCFCKNKREKKKKKKKKKKNHFQCGQGADAGAKPSVWHHPHEQLHLKVPGFCLSLCRCVQTFFDSRQRERRPLIFSGTQNIAFQVVCKCLQLPKVSSPLLDCYVSGCGSKKAQDYHGKVITS